MILLDTHAWIWWVNEDERLSSRAHEIISHDDSVGVSVISCWEVAMLVAKQRIGFMIDVQDWIEQALARPKLRLLQLTPKIIVSSTRLPGNFAGDPADCMIVATCLHHGVSLVSKDRKVQGYRQVNVIW
ncbi:MAG: type II toxin-antitoxin system VapC family toxin [bacterium]